MAAPMERDETRVDVDGRTHRRAWTLGLGGTSYSSPASAKSSWV